MALISLAPYPYLGEVGIGMCFKDTEMGKPAKNMLFPIINSRDFGDSLRHVHTLDLDVWPWKLYSFNAVTFWISVK
jgi:hypothetical protein